jgi:hypothetical protein
MPDKLIDEIVDRHLEFCRWYRESDAVTKRLRESQFVDFTSLEQLPTYAIGWLDLLKKQSYQIPIPFRSDKDRYTIAVAKTFVRLVEDAYAGDYVLARETDKNPHLLVLRRLNSNHFALFKIALVFEGNLLTAQFSYWAYRCCLCAPDQPKGCDCQWPIWALTASTFQWVCNLGRDETRDCVEWLFKRPKELAKSEAKQGLKQTLSALSCIPLSVTCWYLQENIGHPFSKGLFGFLSLGFGFFGFCGVLWGLLALIHRFLYDKLTENSRNQFAAPNGHHHCRRPSGLLWCFPSVEGPIEDDEVRIFVERMVESFNRAIMGIEDHSEP